MEEEEKQGYDWKLKWERLKKKLREENQTPIQEKTKPVLQDAKGRKRE